MPQLIYVVEPDTSSEDHPIYVSSITPVATTTDLSSALQYDVQGDATATATYLNSLDNGTTYFIGHVPVPHH